MVCIFNFRKKLKIPNSLREGGKDSGRGSEGRVQKGMNTFEDLETWKSARELRKAISKLVKTFPNDERFRLVDQIIRSSVPANNPPC